jgi:branched-chain amino acid aminotransferase
MQNAVQNAVVWVNGKILNPSEAKVSVYDRSYLYGDSLYEVVRTYHGRFFAMKEHLARLHASARLCHFDVTQSDAEIIQACESSLQAFQKFVRQPQADAYCRIIVSRGEGKIGFGKNCLTTGSLVTVIVQPIEAPTDAKRREGIRLRFAERIRLDRRALEPAIKSGNYLNCLLAYLEAVEATGEDALLCDGDGFVSEGTTFNVFYVKRGILVTPPLDIGILEGITRRLVIEIARKNGIPVREARFPRERIYEADEAFLTGTIKEILPIREIEGRRIGTDHRPITDLLWREFRKVTQGLT